MEVTDLVENAQNNITTEESVSDCPQSDIKEENVKEEVVIENWKDDENYCEQEVQSTNDEGYEGDMEGDGELMPPPSTVP